MQLDTRALTYYHAIMKNQGFEGIELAIAIPTYNEAVNIKSLIRQIKNTVTKAKIHCTTFIIDDDSPDGTGKIADELSERETNSYFKIKVLHRQEKNGLGRAYIDGFNEILRGQYTHVLQMDADFSHNPKYIPLFLEASKNNDLVVGSRYIKGGGTPDWALRRKMLSQLGNMYIRTLLGNTIHDYTGGFNLYSQKLLRQIPLDSISSTGYEFLISLKYQALKYVDSISEVPIVFLDRRFGKSKLPKTTMIKTLFLVPKIKIKGNL